MHANKLQMCQKYLQHCRLYQQQGWIQKGTLVSISMAGRGRKALKLSFAPISIVIRYKTCQIQNNKILNRKNEKCETKTLYI